MIIVFAVFIGLIALSAIAIANWKGIWRILAAIPIIGIVGAAIKIFIDGSANPTSHNLWPFEILIVGGIGFLFLLIIAGLRYLFQLLGSTKPNRGS